MMRHPNKRHYSIIGRNQVFAIKQYYYQGSGANKAHVFPSSRAVVDSVGNCIGWFIQVELLLLGGRNVSEVTNIISAKQGIEVGGQLGSDDSFTPTDFMIEQWSPTTSGRNGVKYNMGNPTQLVHSYYGMNILIQCTRRDGDLHFPLMVQQSLIYK